MADYTAYKELKVEKSNRVAIVTLNRPESLNSFGGELVHETELVMAQLAEDEEVNAVVLTGAGKAFSAGGDIRSMQSLLDNPKPPRPMMRRSYKLVDAILSVDKPIIAAVNGDAVGLGATVALLCDIILAAENARFADPHVRIGLVAGDGGALIWPMLIGIAKAKQYLLTGDFIDAREAERIGLVNKVVPQDQVLSEAVALADRLAGGATSAINWTKMAINQYLKQAMNLVLPASVATEYLSFHSADHREAVAAFIEKRRPKFAGD